MARKSSRSRSTRSRQDGGTKSRRARPAEAEVVAEPESGGGATGLAVITTVLLVAAILCVDALLGKYAAGVFF